MKYLNARQGYEATQAEIAELPSWHEAGQRPELGVYRTTSASTHGPAIVEVRKDPMGNEEEVFSHVRIVPPVRDAIISPLDEEFHFQKY